MPGLERRALIAEIEQLRGSRVIAYVTGDRQPVGGQIGDDAVRPLFEHLRAAGAPAKLDLFIYSRGGAIDVPWRIATALRSVCKEWNVVVPFRANSAATLLALGADSILLGPQGELGPIDPILNLRSSRPDGTAAQDHVPVEDVMSFVKFLRDRAELTDQTVRAQGLLKLLERLDAISIGNAYRTHLHIRDVARKMLLSRKRPPEDTVVENIIETLAGRVYAHGHAIGFTEAKAIGLPVLKMPADLDAKCWRLLGLYERDLKILEPLDPFAALGQNDSASEEATLAVLDSTWASSEFRAQVDVVGRRQMPQQLNVSLNLNLQLPPGIDPANVPPQLAGMVQQLQQQLLGPATQAVQAALRRQAPITDAQLKMRPGRWVTEPAGAPAP